MVILVLNDIQKMNRVRGCSQQYTTDLWLTWLMNDIYPNKNRQIAYRFFQVKSIIFDNR